MVQQQQQQPRLPSAALFERVAHYASPQPSPPTYKTRMRFHASVAPFPIPSTPLKPRHTESSERLIPAPPREEEGIPHVAARAGAARGERRAGGEEGRLEHGSRQTLEEREEDKIKARQKVK